MKKIKIPKSLITSKNGGELAFKDVFKIAEECSNTLFELYENIRSSEINIPSKFIFDLGICVGTANTIAGLNTVIDSPIKQQLEIYSDRVASGLEMLKETFKNEIHEDYLKDMINDAFKKQEVHKNTDFCDWNDKTIEYFKAAEKLYSKGIL